MAELSAVKKGKRAEIVAQMPVISSSSRSSGSVQTGGSTGVIETTTTTTEDKEEIFIATPYLKALDSPKSPAIHFHDNSSATDVLGYREEEKKEMQRLNTRLAEYIEMVHFLQGENKMLREKLSHQKPPVVVGDNNEEFYKAKQAEFMKLKAEMEKEIGQLRKELQEIQTKCISLKRETETEKGKLEVILKLEREGFERELDKNRHDYIEKLAALERHYETMRKAYEEQISDILGKDKHDEHQEYFRHEISEAIREIRRMNDAILESKKQHLERFYQRKVQELESSKAQSDSEINYYRKRVSSLEQLVLEQRTEFESRIVMLEETLKGKESLNVSHKDCVEMINERNLEINELKLLLKEIREDRDKLLSTKLTLTEEIETYKKLLESVDFRISERSTPNGSATGLNENYSEGEVRVKTQYRQTSVGSVAIRTDTQGAFVLVENTKGPAPEDTSLDGWFIEQTIERGEHVRYSFPHHFVLGANKSVKVWSKSFGQKPTSDNLLANNVWLSGDKMMTRLVDANGTEISTFSQESVKTSQGTVV